jgi:hypothetical protein
MIVMAAQRFWIRLPRTSLRLGRLGLALAAAWRCQIGHPEPRSCEDCCKGKSDPRFTRRHKHWMHE